MHNTVYGEDCRFFLDAKRSWHQRCLHPHARLRVETPVSHLQMWMTPGERNPYHDCRDFRPWRRWEQCGRLDPAFLLVGGLLLFILCGVWCVYHGRIGYG